MKKGFTLAEMLATIAIIGTLAIILIPALNDSRPNKELLMYRKAFSITERVVSELVNDEELYPELEGDLRGHYLANLTKVKYHDNEFEGKGKFAGLFMARLNMLTPASGAKAGRFTTADGVQWFLPVTDFASNKARIILVDMNGDKDPNCYYASKDACRNEPDRFKIKIYNDGRVVPGGCMEKEYLERRSTSRGAGISVINPDNLDGCKADGDIEDTEWKFGDYSS